VHWKLKELSEKSTVEVDTSGRRFYWQADGYKFNNTNLARWYEKENNCWVDLVDAQFDAIKQNLSQQTFDPKKNYNLEFIRYLKNKYPKVNLLYSGGYNSTKIFHDFVSNGLSLDEVIVNIGLDIEPEITNEVLSNVNPFLEKYDSLVKKKSFIQYTYEQIRQRWSSEWALFDGPWARMPPWCSNVGLGYGTEIDSEACYIKGVDNPTLVLYKDRWYVVSLDANLGAHFEIPNLTYFWLDSNNIMSLIKDSHLYRDWLIRNDEVKDGLQFFYMKDMDEGMRQDLDWIKIPRPDLKLPKALKIEMRKHRMIDNEKFTEMSYYCNALKKVQEMVPEMTEGVKGSGKFGWFIDIDTLEIKTQRQLIPDGF
jgi:hypothetical protein